MKAHRILILTLTVLTIGASLALAVGPLMMNYQGLLTDADDNPLNGTYSLTFRLYPEATAGDPVLWSETQAGVEVIDGVFSVVLGSVTPLPTDLFNDDELWLGVTVEDDDEISPRMRLTSTPWSFRAAVADTALTGSDGGAGDGHSLDAADGDPVDVVYVDNDGRVGIGTLTPEPTVGIDIVKRTLITNNGVSCVFSGHPDDDLFYLSAFEEGNSAVKKPIGLNPWGGNVGIGITAPSAVLHAVGNPSPRFILSGSQQTENNTTTLYLSHVAHENSQKVAIISQATGSWGKGKLHLAVNPENNYDNADTNDAKLTVMGNGRVGIGTREPSERLQVDGVVHSMQGGFKFPDGSVQFTSAMGSGFTLPYSGTATNAHTGFEIITSWPMPPPAGSTITGIHGTTTCMGNTNNTVLYGGYFEASGVPFGTLSTGVYGAALNFGVRGVGDTGVRGLSSADDGIGVEGLSTYENYDPGAPNTYGGRFTATENANGIGVFGEGLFAGGYFQSQFSENSAAIRALGPYAAKLQGEVLVRDFATAGLVIKAGGIDPAKLAVYSDDTDALYCESSPDHKAGYFQGDVFIDGRLDIEGRLRVGEILPTQGFELDVTGLTGGELIAYLYATRFLDNINPLRDDWSKILQAAPVSGRYKESGAEAVGLLADDMHALGLTNLVLYADGEPASVNYRGVTCYLLEILKEQVAKNKELNKQVASLQREVEELHELESRVAALETR